MEKDKKPKKTAEQKKNENLALLKEIKGKIKDTTSIPDDEIIGKPSFKGKSEDLIPTRSFLVDEEESPLGKKISDFFHNLGDSYQRDDRYERYKTAIRNPEIDGALDIYASETATQDTEGKILNVFCSSEKVTEVINDLFKRLGLEDRAFDIVRNFCGYGDEFYEIIYSKSAKGIHSINQIPRELIGRKEINGVLQNFYVRKTKKMKETEDASYSFDYSYKINTGSGGLDNIDPIRVLHWKIPSTEYAPYGKSVLDSVITPLEELRLMEQSLLIARITRAPERRVYYVNVGSAQGEKGIAMAREVVSRLKRKNILDKLGKGMDSNVDFFGSIEDITIPFRVGEEKSTIESLPQLNDPGALTDLEFIRDRIFPGLGIPRTYLFDDTFANSNSNLSNKSIAFAKRIRRIQKYFLYPIYKLAYIELKLKGIKEKDFEDLLITMNNPSNTDEREKIDLETLKWGLISNIKSMNAEKVFFPDYYIYKNTLNMSNDEILDLMIQNLAQEGGKNPFSMIPEEERPKDYLVIDQLKGGGSGEAPIGDEDGDGIPDEAEGAFGEAPPIEGETGGEETGLETPEAPPEEELAPETASLIYRQVNNKKALFESLEKAKSFKKKREQKEKIKEVDLVKANKKYTTPIYSESQLNSGNEFEGIKNVIGKVIY